MSPIYRVTVAETAYTTYTVEAGTAEEAESLVRNPDSDLEQLMAAGEGYGGDQEIINVREVVHAPKITPSQAGTAQAAPSTSGTDHTDQAVGPDHPHPADGEPEDRAP